jgi:hypothetical protein
MLHQIKRMAIPVLMLLCVVLCATSVNAEIRTVRRGENLQTILNGAKPGDIVLLEAGAEFVGNFVLPVKTGDAPIVVRSAFNDGLPAAGQRIQPGHAPMLARIRSPNTAAALRTAAAAHHWHLLYLEFAANKDGFGDIIQLGDGGSAQNTLAKVPHDLYMSHLYVHGDALQGQKRCVALNAATVTIRDSYIADCKGVGNDTQAIGGWNGPGPYLIENNYLEAAGENVLFGGSDPAIANLVADGITVRGNLFSRPLAWRNPIIPTPQVTAAAEAGGGLPAGIYAYRVIARRPVGQGTTGRSTASAELQVSVGDGGAVRLSWAAVPGAVDYRVYGRGADAQNTYWTVNGTSFVDTGAAGTAGDVPTSAGTLWSVKNIFELKNARNVVVELNVFENHWKESQPGYAIVFTPRNSGGTCTWCVVEYVRFERNIVRHVAAGINLLGYDAPTRPSRQTNAVVIRNNVFEDVSTAYGGNGWFMLMGDEPRDIVIDHNTVSHNGSSFIFLYGGTSTDAREMYNVRITNNAARHASYGVNGNYFGFGNGVITTFLPGGTVTGNFFSGGSASRYPAGNVVAGGFEAQFVDAARGDFRLATDSRLRGTATDGGDIGADLGSLAAAMATAAGTGSSAAVGTSVLTSTGVTMQSNGWMTVAPVAPSNMRVISQ